MPAPPDVRVGQEDIIESEQRGVNTDLVQPNLAPGNLDQGSVVGEGGPDFVAKGST